MSSREAGRSRHAPGVPPPDAICRRGPTYAQSMSAIEWCECCLAEAPGWSTREYAEWVVLLAEDGAYLGVVCAGCVADEELLRAELEASAPSAATSRPHRRVRRGSRSRGGAARRRGRALSSQI